MSAQIISRLTKPKRNVGFLVTVFVTANGFHTWIRGAAETQLVLIVGLNVLFRCGWLNQNKPRPSFMGQ